MANSLQTLCTVPKIIWTRSINEHGRTVALTVFDFNNRMISNRLPVSISYLRNKHNIFLLNSKLGGMYNVYIIHHSWLFQSYYKIVNQWLHRITPWYYKTCTMRCHLEKYARTVVVVFRQVHSFESTWKRVVSSRHVTVRSCPFANVIEPNNVL